MTKKQADQLRRAIARLITARSDCDYAARCEPHNSSKTDTHHARCVRRLERLITSLIDKRDATTEGCVSREALDAPAEKQSGVLPV